MRNHSSFEKIVVVLLCLILSKLTDGLISSVYAGLAMFIVVLDIYDDLKARKEKRDARSSGRRPE